MNKLKRIEKLIEELKQDDINMTKKYKKKRILLENYWVLIK